MNDEDVCILVNGSKTMTSLEVGQEYILCLSNGSSATWTVVNATLSAHSGVSVKLFAQTACRVTVWARANGRTYTCELQMTKKSYALNVSFTNLSEYKVVVCRNGLSTEITTVEAGGIKSVYVSFGTNEITFYFRYSYCIINDDDNGTIWMDVADNSAYTYTVDSADIAQDTMQINIPAPKNPKFDVAYLKVENKSSQPISLYKTLYKLLSTETSPQKLYNKTECYIDPWHSGVYRIPMDALFESFTLGASYLFSATAVTSFYAESGVLYTCEFSEAVSTINVREEIRLCEAGEEAEGIENTYTVHHFLQDTNLNTYTLKDTESLTGMTGETTIANAKNYIGFTAKDFEQQTISADGTTVVEIYYDRNAYSVRFDANGGMGKAQTQTFYYGVPQYLQSNMFTHEKYTFIGWAISATDNPTYGENATLVIDGNTPSDITLYATWFYTVTEATVESMDLKYISSDYTLKVVGDISQDTFHTLAKKIRTLKDSINLDLSESTGFTKIGVFEFRACNKIKSVIIPSCVRTIGAGAFDYCTNLQSVEINEVETIEEWAFSYCENLLSVTIKSVGSIGSSAFQGCENLLSLTIKSVDSIGDSVFWGCKSLKSVVLKNTKTISRNAFSKCSDLETVEIDGAESGIDSHAFGEGCDSLKSVVLKNTKIIG